MKKQIKIFLWILLILLFTAAGITAAAWIISSKTPVRPENLKCTLTPQHVGLGEDAVAVCTFTLPLCRRVDQVTVLPAAGSLAAGEPRISWQFNGFSTRKWQIRIPLRPYRPGEIKPGKIRFSAGKREQDQNGFTAELPGFTAKEGKASQQLALAPEASLKKFDHRMFYWLLLLLIPAGILLARHLRKRKKQKELTEWEKAARELAELKQGFYAGSLAPEQAFVGLVELMRRYLEKRFSIPVTRRTAQEFLLMLDRHADKLPNDSRPFLRAFIQEADMVKFARAVPEHAAVTRSAESAENFILHTRPESEVKNV